MTTHTIDPRFMPTAPRQAAATLHHPALATAAAIVGCVLVAVLIGLVLTALISGGQPVTVQHQIGHAAAVGVSGTVSAGTAYGSHREGRRCSIHQRAPVARDAPRSRARRRQDSRGRARCGRDREPR